MPHIALITSSYPDGAPGSEAAGSFVADFAQELSTHVRVTVLAASSAESVTMDGDLTVRRFAVPRMPLSLLRPSHPLDWIPILQALRSGRAAVESIAKTNCPDHVLALWALPGGYWAQSAARRHGVPFSVWALGSDVWTLGKIPLVRTKLRNVLRQASYRFADGLQLAADVEKICNRPCSFLPSTRHLPRSGSKTLPDAAPYKLAFLGRWHKNKGIDLLLEALSLLNDEDWHKISEIRINGGGPLGDRVDHAVQELQRHQRPVSLGGYLDKQGAADLITWADYLLLPSRIESIPVIFSDALQLGTPLVATPVGDLPRLYDKFSFGVLASTTTATGYAEALRSALSQDASAFLSSINDANTEFDLRVVARRFIEHIKILR